MACPSCGSTNTSEQTQSATYGDKMVIVTYTQCNSCGSVSNKSTREVTINKKK